jgi:hypothetical protein
MEALSGLFLVGVSLLSLVLPLTASAGPKSVERGRRSILLTVLTGQLLIAVGGLWIIAMPTLSAYGLIFVVASCLGCLPVLRRQLRPT